MRFCTVNGLDKPCFKVYNAQTLQWDMRFDNMIHMWYKGAIRFGDVRFGRHKDYDASIEMLHSPLSSTSLHF